MSLDDLFMELKGGGHFGHAGRPGKRGGSLPKGGGASSSGKLEVDKRVRSIVEKLGPKHGLVGEIQVASWDKNSGANRKAAKYRVNVANAGVLAKSTDKEELKKLASELGIDVSDKTHGR